MLFCGVSVDADEWNVPSIAKEEAGSEAYGLPAQVAEMADDVLRRKSNILGCLADPRQR